MPPPGNMPLTVAMLTSPYGFDRTPLHDSRSRMERHTLLMDVALDRDEETAIRLQQEHCGAFRNMGGTGATG